DRGGGWARSDVGRNRIVGEICHIESGGVRRQGGVHRHKTSLEGAEARVARDVNVVGGTGISATIGAQRYDEVHRARIRRCPRNHLGNRSINVAATRTDERKCKYESDTEGFLGVNRRCHAESQYSKG